MSLSSSDGGLAVPQRYWAILTIAIGLIMAVLDGSIANVALPTISRELQASPAQSVWVINAYQIAIVASLLSLSFLGDIVGYRRVYQAGLVVFAITSVFCALSPSLPLLTLGRVLQGLGGAAIMSVNTALIRIIYPPRYLGRGIAINALLVAISTAAGPTVAAAILSFASWRWLFLINLPLGVVTLWLALRYLPDNPQRAKTQKFDVTSAVSKRRIQTVLTFRQREARPSMAADRGPGSPASPVYDR
ncbi:putative transport protein [Pantoea stewartii subsp. stewartii DC283]|uniref:Putative transport protein n=1 Tax=Pantoea stewartii subsp. stewartii DC283 TaxID=660596 RepID=H3RDH6_PANSE|nr:putative transport protein [Pantoea stewartii subsp. stewartii DC283]